MNTKGTKFLAVLAVLALAFAGFAVIASEDVSDADSKTVEDVVATAAPTTTEAVSADTNYIVKTGTSAATQKLTLADVTGAVVYMLPGKYLELTSVATAEELTIIMASSIEAGSTDGKYNITYDVDEEENPLYTFTADSSTAAGTGKLVIYFNSNGSLVLTPTDDGTEDMIGFTGMLIEATGGETFTAYVAGQTAAAVTYTDEVRKAVIIDGSAEIITKVDTTTVTDVKLESIEGAAITIASVGDNVATYANTADAAEGSMKIIAGGLSLANGAHLGKIIPTGYVIDTAALAETVATSTCVLQKDVPTATQMSTKTNFITIAGSASPGSLPASTMEEAGTVTVATYKWTGSATFTMKDGYGTTANKAADSVASFSGKDVSFQVAQTIADGTPDTITAVWTAPTEGELTIKSNAELTSWTLLKGVVLTIASTANVTLKTAFTTNVGDAETNAAKFVVDGNVSLNGAVTITLNGDTYVNGVLDMDATVIGGSGTIYIGTSGVVEMTSYESGHVYSSAVTDTDKNTPIWGTWTTDLTIDKTFFLSDDLVIAEGAEFTIVSGGTLFLNGYNVALNGSLEIKTGGSVSALGFDNSLNDLDEGIAIGKTGELDNSGILGLGGAPLTIWNAQDTYKGVVSLQNVTGVSIDYAKYNSPEYTGVLSTSEETKYYYMTVSGEANKFTGTGSTSTYQVIIDDDVILGSIDVATGVSLESIATATLVAKNSYLAVSGDITGTFYMETGSVLDATGGKVSGTAKLVGYTGAIKAGSDAVQSGLYQTSVTLANAQGVSVSMVKSNYSKDSASYVQYSLQVAGKLSQVTKEAAGAALVTIAKEADCPAERAETGYVDYIGAFVTGSLEIDAKMEAAVAAVSADANSMITVTGVIFSTSDGMVSAENANKFYTAYSVKESSTKTVYYMTTFEAALAVIDDTVDGITVYGTFDITQTFTLDSKKPVTIDSTAVITIPASVTVTVAKGSTMTGAIDTVEGKLVKMDGSDVTVPSHFMVMTKSATNDITYSGLQPAIDDADVGDVITLTSAATDLSSLTIPLGVTLDANGNPISTKSNGNLTVYGTLIAEDVTVGGKLIVAGTMKATGDVEVKGTTSVTGEADLSAAAATFDDKVTSTGLLAIQTGTATTQFVGALTSDGSESVLTTLPQAIIIAALAEEDTIIVYGAYTDTTDVILAEGMKLVISNSGTDRAVLATVGIAGATVDATAGYVTATFEGLYGTEGAEASVSVAEAKIAVSDLSALNSSGAEEYTFAITSLKAGSVEIEAGTVKSAVELTVNADQEFVVDYGATLKVTAGKLGGNGNVDIDGALEVAGDFEFSATTSDVSGAITVAKGKTMTVSSGTMNLTGTIEVKGTLDIDGTMNVLGAIDASAEDAEIKADGTLTIGQSAYTAAGASVTGKLTLGANKFITVFPGNIFVAEGLVYADYYINGDLYKTAYANSGNTIKTIAGVMKDKEVVITGYDMSGLATYSNWKDASGAALTSDVNIGKATEVYFFGTAQKVTVLPSVGVGMSLYIDGVLYESGTQKEFSIGSHTVQVTINPGYAGTTEIKFNGQTVTGGKITLTAEMTESEYVALTVTGDLHIDTGDDPAPVQKEDNTITIILLVVLVIVVTVMAVITALRLMRN